MDKGRNRRELKVRHKLASIGRRNMLTVILAMWRGQVRCMNGSSAARYAVQFCSIQNPNQTTAGLGLGFEGKLVQMGCNFTEIWESF